MINKLKNKASVIIKSPIFIQTLVTFILRILGVLCLLGLTIFLTQNYTSENVGQYDFVRIFLLLVSSITIFGADQSILFFAGTLKGKQELFKLKEIYVKTSFMIGLVSILFLLIFLLVGKSIVHLFFDDERTYILILKSMITLIFYSLTLYNTETLRALGKINLAELFRNIFKYFSLIIGAFILIQVEREEFLVDTFLIGFVILSIVSGILILRYFNQNNYNSRLSNYEYAYLFKSSMPIGISTLGMFLLFSIDIILLKKYYGDATVAYYSLAIKIITVLLIIVNTITITLSPILAEHFELKDFKKLNHLMRNSARIIFTLSFVITLFFLFFSNEILSVFGNDYLIAKKPLIILLLSQTICSIFGASGVYMNMTGRQKTYQIIIFISVLINLILNFILIPKFGMEGAAASFGVSFLFCNMLVAIIIYNKDRVNVMIR